MARLPRRQERGCGVSDHLIAEHTDWTADQWAERWRQEAEARNELFRENAAMRAGLAEAYKLIDVLYMDALDNHKESWPRAREWMELWKEVAK